MTDVSNPSADPTTEPAQEPADPTAEIARLRDELVKARKWEDRAKANSAAARELETLRAASMTDIERARAEAKAETRTEVLREVGTTRVADHVRLAASGRQIDVDALLEGLNLERFVDDDGNPDTKAIGVYMDRIAPTSEPTEPPRPQVPAGVRQSNSVKGDARQDFAKFIGVR